MNQSQQSESNFSQHSKNNSQKSYNWSGVIAHLAMKETEDNLKQTQVLYTKTGRLVHSNNKWYYDNKGFWCDP
jgi:hypothetical protein